MLRRFHRSGLSAPAFITQRRLQVSPATVYNEAQALSIYYRRLGDDETARAVRVPFPPLHPQRPFSEDELARLRAVASDRDWRLLELLLLTGLRPRELVSVWQVTEAGPVTVVGKGNRVRRVILPYAPWGIVPDTYGILWYRLRKLSRKSGVHCTAQRCRVTFAHRFASLAGLQEAQFILGHARISTTAHYTRWAAEERALKAHEQFLVAGG